MNALFALSLFSLALAAPGPADLIFDPTPKLKAARDRLEYALENHEDGEFEVSLDYFEDGSTALRVYSQKYRFTNSVLHAHEELTAANIDAKLDDTVRLLTSASGEDLKDTHRGQLTNQLQTPGYLVPSAGLMLGAPAYAKVWVEIPGIKDRQINRVNDFRSYWLQSRISVEATLDHAETGRTVGVTRVESAIYALKGYIFEPGHSMHFLVKVANVRGAARAGEEQDTKLRMELDFLELGWTHALFPEALIRPYYTYAFGAGLRFIDETLRTNFSVHADLEFGLLVDNRVLIFGAIEGGAAGSSKYQALKAGVGYRVSDSILLKASANHTSRKYDDPEDVADPFFLLPEGWSVTGGAMMPF